MATSSLVPAPATGDMTSGPGLPLPVQLFQLTTGMWVTQAISVAARLGVADALGGGPRSCADVAATVGAHDATLYRLLRALADIGLFEELPGRRFRVTPLGQFLRSDHPHSMRGWATMMGAPFYRDAWGALEGAVRTGRPSFATVHGADLFSYLGAHPDDEATFDTAMRCIASNFLAGILAVYDFSGYATIVDVGGGTGALLAAILRAAPSARGILVDQPTVLAQADDVLDAHGVADRYSAVAADFFDAVPAGGDLYILSNIIHDWDDDAAVHILTTCRHAMQAGSRLLIIELVLPDDTQPSFAKLLDLEMLSVTPSGRQRRVSEYARLLSTTGFQLRQAAPAVLGAPASYIEATPKA